MPPLVTVAVKLTGVSSVAVDGPASAVAVTAAGPGDTVNDAVPVDPLNAEPALGVKTAFSVCAPTASAASVVDAVPPLTVTGEPMLVAPSKNCTVPEAVGLTVAVKVRFVPTCCGLLGLTPRVVVVEVKLTAG